MDKYYLYVNVLYYKLQKSIENKDYSMLEYSDYRVYSIIKKDKGGRTLTYN